MAIGDMDGDGNEDVFIGGARGQEGTVYLHQGNGRLVKKQQQALSADAIYEDTAASLSIAVRMSFYGKCLRRNSPLPSVYDTRSRELGKAAFE